MRITKEEYYKTMAKALLKGFFAGLKEKGKKGLSRRQRGILRGESASGRRKVKRS